MRTVTLTHDYPVPPATLWALVTDYGALAEVMRGLVHFDGLPQGRTETGQHLQVGVSLFGRLPRQPYEMTVLRSDDAAMVLQSSERGAGVKSWNHTLTVTPTQGGSRLTDVIEIDAGWLTFAFARWARFLYGARHKPRMRLLGVA
ncbi:SRPBCC family protein [Actibacterium mucosum]|uniref:SRPBCC family protein n=1 Tax=Actibacterium mucosum TaxID=1087332 RepID=UPI001377B69F|nr:SRPBCC family protein [Actibacterium mucosum]